MSITTGAVYWTAAEQVFAVSKAERREPPQPKSRPHAFNRPARFGDRSTIQSIPTPKWIFLYLNLAAAGATILDNAESVEAAVAGVGRDLEVVVRVRLCAELSLEVSKEKDE